MKTRTLETLFVLLAGLAGFGLGFTGCGSSNKATTLQCVLNSDCSGALVCAQGYCVAACITSHDCAGNARCIIILDLGNVCQAIEKQTCAYNSQCAPLLCGVDLECRNQCQTDFDCPNGQKCTTTSKLCVDPIKDSSHYDPATNELIPAPDAGARDSGTTGQAGAGATGTGGLGGVGAAGKGGHGGNGGAGAGGASAGGSKGVDGGTADSGRGDASADVSVLIPWHLWVIETTTRHLYGYTAAQLQTTNGDAPAIDLALPAASAPQSLPMYPRFDRDGNLWIWTGSNGGTAFVWKFTPAQLASGGPLTPAAVLQLPASAIGGWITFDKSDNLWVDEFLYGSGKVQVARFDAADVATLSATASALTPKFLITSTPSRGGLVFDATGDLFLITSNVLINQYDYSPLGRYDASQLVGTGAISSTPALTTTPTPPFGYQNTYAQDMVLTPSGELAASSGDLFLFASAQIALSGSQSSFPPKADLTVTGETGFSVTYLAVDPEGNIYLSGNQNHVLKLGAADLAAKTGIASVAAAMTLRAPTANSGASFGSLVVH